MARTIIRTIIIKIIDKGKSKWFSKPTFQLACFIAKQHRVAANRELIARFEKKIQSTLARVWGETRTNNA